MIITIKIIASLPRNKEEQDRFATKYTEIVARRLGVVTSFNSIGAFFLEDHVHFDPQIIIEGPIDDEDALTVHELTEDFRELGIRPVLLIYFGPKLIWNGDYDVRFEEREAEKERAKQAESEAPEDPFFSPSGEERDDILTTVRRVFPRGPFDPSGN